MAGKTAVGKQEISGEIAFFTLLGKMKRIGRRGWNLRGIETPETIADHSYRTAVLAYYYAEKFGLDVAKTVGLALLHDINEVETGENPGDKFSAISKEKKIRDGQASLKKITFGLPKAIAKKYSEMWADENLRKGKEASIARDVNKLELAFQALDYELAGHPGERLDDMWAHAKKNVYDLRLKAVLSSLEKMRPGKRKK